MTTKPGIEMDTIRAIEETYISNIFGDWGSFKSAYFEIERKIAELEGQGFTEISIDVVRPGYDDDGHWIISYTRPMTPKEIEARNKRTVKAREARKKAAEKRKEQDLKELTRLKAKYES